MARNSGKKVSFFKSVTLTYKCGCKHDFPKINVLMIDKEREFASRVKCKDCCKND